MVCYHPLKAYRSKTLTKNGKRGMVFQPNEGYVDRPVTLPCGQCSGCRLERSRQWAIRCHHEASLHQQNSFVTLTYDDLHLPTGGTLVVRDLQLFMKRLRKKYGEGIRFYACGEYGDTTGRPHYHACLFNFQPPDLKHFSTRQNIRTYTSEILDDLWGNGFTLTGDVTFQSAAYVARYIMKKINGPDATQHYENVDPETGEITSRKPEFTTMSRRPGIGKEWLNKYVDDVYNHDYVVINGKKVRAPRYYDQQYEISDPENLARLKIRRLRAAKSHAQDQTPARLKVREYIADNRLSRLPRTLGENQNDP